MTCPPLPHHPDAPAGTAPQARPEDAFRAEDERFVARLHAELEEFFGRQRAVLGGISADALPLLDAVVALSAGGKRLRARLCYWGWRAAGGDPEDPAVVRAGAALELFQSAALIHDDVIDRSDTRRGAPSVHRRFESVHADRGWALDGPAFGVAAAILSGDLCLSWSEQLFAAATATADGGHRARTVFDLMRSEVMAGQYLDVQGEVAGHPVSVDGGRRLRSRGSTDGLGWRHGRQRTPHAGRVVDANEGMCTLLDVPLERLRGTPAHPVMRWPRPTAQAMRPPATRRRRAIWSLCRGPSTCSPRRRSGRAT